MARRLLRDGALDRIREATVTGHLAPGEVSRTPTWPYGCALSVAPAHDVDAAVATTTEIWTALPSELEESRHGTV